MEVKELVNIFKEIDRITKNDPMIGLYLRIDLFMDVDDAVFYEAMRQSGVSEKDYWLVSHSRHVEKAERNKNRS